MEPPFVQLLEEQIKRHDLGDRGGVAQLIFVLGVKHAAGIAVDDDFGEARTSACGRICMTPRRVFMVPTVESDPETRVMRVMGEMPEMVTVMGFGGTAERRKQRCHETCQDHSTPTSRQATHKHHASNPLKPHYQTLSRHAPPPASLNSLAKAKNISPNARIKLKCLGYPSVKVIG